MKDETKITLKKYKTSGISAVICLVITWVYIIAFQTECYSPYKSPENFSFAFISFAFFGAMVFVFSIIAIASKKQKSILGIVTLKALFAMVIYSISTW